MKDFFVNLKTQNAKLVRMTGKPVVKMMERIYGPFSLVGDFPFFESQIFDWTEDLESHWQVIRQELEILLQYRVSLPNFYEIAPQNYRLASDDGWKVFFLYMGGVKNEGSCQKVPETTKILEKIPNLYSAFFSIISPHQHIPPHCGDYKGVIRCHLGLIVPQPQEKCRIRVSNEIRHWEEGKVIFLDDTFEHEVWNGTDGIRVVLILDIRRPLMFPVSLLNNFILKLLTGSPYIQDIFKNQNQLNKRLETTMKK